MKAVVSATMGAFDTFANGKERVEGRRALNEIRSKLAQGENVPVMITVPDIDENSPDFMKDYYGYYRTDRGYHKRSINSGCGWNPTTFLSHYTNDTLTAKADSTYEPVSLEMIAAKDYSSDNRIIYLYVRKISERELLKSVR